MKKILVLGGGGFIGGHLSKRLYNEGNYVRVVDVKEHEYFTNYCSEFIKGDLRDNIFVMRAFQNTNNEVFDEVYQLAADMGGAGYINTGENDADVMYNSTMINLNVLHESLRTNVKKIFYSSSACVYPEFNQENELNPNCKEHTVYPAQPDSNYGWEKLYGERLYSAYEKNYKIDVRIARFHNIFGPYGTFEGGKEKVPAALCRKIVRAIDEIEIWGDGNQTRSFLYIDDCIDAVIKLMESNCKEPINIGSEELISINHLAQNIVDISEKNIKFKYIDGPLGVRGRNSDNTLIREKLDWSPKHSLHYGLNKTYLWIKSQCI